MLDIKLFGTGQISYKNQSITGLPAQQPLLMLCYLILQRGRLISREHLATVFWQEASSCLARKNLRNAFWRLRQIFQSLGVNIDDYVILKGDDVEFAISSNCQLDIDVFEESACKCQDIPGQDLSEEQVAQLEHAINLYRGDLLENVYEDWCFYQREQLRLFYLNILSKLILYHGLKGSYEHAIVFGEKLLALDPLRETTYQQMMWLHCLAGERNAAVSLFDRLSSLLREELGVSPMDETRAIHSQIISNHPLPRQWPLPFEHLETLPNNGDGDNTLLIEQTINKLHRLQRMVEQTSNELSLLERLISSAIRLPQR